MFLQEKAQLDAGDVVCDMMLTVVLLRELELFLLIPCFPTTIQTEEGHHGRTLITYPTTSPMPMAG